MVRKDVHLLYPTPKIVKPGTGAYKLGEGLEIVVDPLTFAEQSASLRKLIDVIGDRTAICARWRALDVPSAGARFCAITVEDDFVACALGSQVKDIVSLQPEGYVLSVDRAGACVSARDARGMLYGLQTLIALIHQASAEDGIQGLYIVDWPHKPLRGVHLYLPAREDLLYARSFASEFLIPQKYNTVFLEVGAGIRFDRHPEVNRGFSVLADQVRSSGKRPVGVDGRFQNSPHAKVAGGRFLEKDELKSLVDYYRSLNLDVIPEIPSLTHSYYLVAGHRELAEMPEAAWPDAYCPSNPETYELLFDLADEILEVFAPPPLPSNERGMNDTQSAGDVRRAVHIGHDEWRCALKCPRCRQRPGHELLVEDVTKIYDFYRERGIDEIWMWGDLLKKTHTGLGRNVREGDVWYDFPVTWQARDALPKDIIMINWGYEGNDRRPEMIEGASELKGAGYRQILGNFSGEEVPERLHPFWFDDETMLGGQVSTWVGFNEFDLAQAGILTTMTSAAQIFWAGTRRAQADYDRQFPIVLSGLRDRMHRAVGRAASPALARDVTREMVSVDLAAAVNARATVVDADGNRVKVTASSRVEGALVPLALCERDGGVWVVSVDRDEAAAAQVTVPIHGVRCDALVFFHSTDQPGGYIRIPDGPTLPYEPLATYRVEYEDGQVKDVRAIYHLNVLESGATGQEPLYYALPPVDIRVGDRSFAISCYEWVNPRPQIKIEAITLNPVRGSTNAKLLLWGITGIMRVASGTF